MAHGLGFDGRWSRLVCSVIFEGRIFSGHEAACGKPYPDLFLAAARQLEGPPIDCVVVEDSQAGVLAARAAEMDVLAFAGGLTAASGTWQVHIQRCS